MKNLKILLKNERELYQLHTGFAKSNKKIDGELCERDRSRTLCRMECQIQTETYGLVQEGIYWGLRYEDGQTILHLITRARLSKFWDDMCSSALASDSDILNAQNPKTGQTALHIAAKHGNRSVVTMLLNHGANPEICDANGKTALNVATSRVVQCALIAAISNSEQNHDVVEDGTSAVEMEQAPDVTQEPDMSYWEYLSLTEGPSNLLDDVTSR